MGAIDIGTNTFLLLIADVEKGKVLNTVLDVVDIVRIGEGVHKNREFLLGALERADSCLKHFRELLNKHNVQQVKAVATSAARDVKNKEKLFEICRKHEIPLEIISGEKEAELTFFGVLTNPDFNEQIVVIDVGGGSTEITYLNDKNKIAGQSRNVGGVRLTESYISQHPVSPQELEALKERLRTEFQDLPDLKAKKTVGVAGTPTTIAALSLQTEYTQEKIEGHTLSIAELDRWIDKLANMTVSERSQLKGLEPKRADIIVAGAATLSEAAKALGAKEIIVSTRGVRYGVAATLG